MTRARQLFRSAGRVRRSGRAGGSVREVHAAGYREVEAYSPLPVEGLAEALGFRRTSDAARGARGRNCRML